MSRPLNHPKKGKSLGLRARGPGTDLRTERRTRAPPQGPSKQNFLGKGGCVFFLVLLSGSWVAWVVFARCLSRLWSCLPLLVPCCFRGAFLLVGAVSNTGIVFFLRYPLGYVSLPTPCGIDCQGAAASSGTSVRCSGRNFGTCIITVVLPSMSVLQMHHVLYVVMNL